MTRLEQIRNRHTHYGQVWDADVEALLDLAEAAIEGWGCDTDALMNAVKKFEEIPNDPA